ncbi:MAG TPA: hypothetical protein VHU88_15255 [Sporichthyaceae bacterium]|jgi:hypothetical protein|nr:hypothetical protein [Sporichthyaceae bacterium]
MSDQDRDYGADFSRDDTQAPDPSWSRSRLSEETEASRELRAARLVYAGVSDAERVSAVIYGSIFRRVRVHVIGLENDLHWVSAVEAMWAAGLVVVLEDILPTEFEGPISNGLPTEVEVRSVDLIVLVGRYESDPEAYALAHRCGTPAVPLRALVQS